MVDAWIDGRTLIAEAAAGERIGPGAQRGFVKKGRMMTPPGIAVGGQGSVCIRDVATKPPVLELSRSRIVAQV